MALLYLIRHARPQMTGAVARRWSLSEEGRREAGVLARQGFWREVELILSSPEPKAVQTAEPAARRWNIPLDIVDCLHELRRPRLLYDYETMIARLFSEPEASIGGMETADHAAERITRCIEELVATHSDQALAMLSHGLVLALFLAGLQDRWPTVAEWRAIPYTGMAIVDTHRWRLIKDWSSVYEIS